MHMLRRYPYASTLPLLVAGFSVANHAHDTIAFHDLAVAADFLD
jgi:hypothetical protein